MVLALLGAVALAPRPATATPGVLFDFEGAYLHQPGYTIKDHDLVRDDGLWHVFYIRGIEGVPGTSTEIQLGHATSPDLRNWNVLPPAIDAGPEEWDLRRVWAPDIRPDGAGWSMYYTGVAPDFLQRTGTASSTDLFAWSKSPQNPTIEPDSTVYVWSPDLDVPELSAFRDPFQFEVDGQQHLLHTALVPDSTLAAGRRGVIHHLVEDGNGGWTDAGPLAVNNNAAIGPWRELESVQLIDDGTRWNLFFTYFGLGGIYWVAADSFDGPWDVSSAQLLDPGVGAEVTPLGNGSWILTRHGAATHASTHPTRAGQSFFVLRSDTLRFDPGGGVPAIVPENSFESRWPERHGLAFLAAPTFGDNFYERGYPHIGKTGNGYLSSLDFYDGPFGSYGAPGATLGESATGSIMSRWFEVDALDSVMTMYVAGPSDPLCTVRLVERVSAPQEALVTADLDSVRSGGLPSFALQTIDLVGWRGRTVRLEVRDLSETGWIALDHVRVFSSDPVLPTASPPASARRAARLLPNLPNPFNPRTELRYHLDRPGQIGIELFDLRGRRLRSIDRGVQPAGEHAFVLDGSDLASGTYLVRLLLDGTDADHRKVSLVR